LSSLVKNRRLVSWFDINKLCQNLCNQISFGTNKETDETIKPDHVIGLARGGLIPATIIANTLGVRTVISHGYHSYDEDTCLRDYRNPHGIMYQDGVIDLRKGLQGPNVLIVDDLCDEGITMDGMVTRLNTKFHRGILNVKTAVLFCKGRSRFRPTYSAEECGDDWLSFPWEP
jgi:uncharacterized protein